MVSYEEFTDMVAILKNSMDGLPTMNKSKVVHKKTIYYWWIKYFRYYDKSFLQRAFDSIQENNIFLNLKSILEAIQKLNEGYLLHTQVELSWRIMDEAEAIGKTVRMDMIPATKIKEVPIKKAWLIAFELRGKKATII